ncbi:MULTISPECIES: hypothetical protein [unclassified Shewanella]|uniref:hypothetical protein n=1 Tax=unclassified Shewanella TaxID=196818 RepID=UPI0006E64AFF|nr:MULTISPECIES: hypothetical protein [unclassified Shewanella]KPZ67249.1 hypothetical protein AN944_04158 [Shewanella sp. P1-14-1]
MKSKAELMAELESLMLELNELMDMPADSPEVKSWSNRVLEIKEQLSQKIH